MRRSVLVAVLLASVGCQRTPAQSQTNTPAPGKAGTATAQPAQTPTGQAGQPSQPAPAGQAGPPPKPGAPGTPGGAIEPPPAKPVPAQLPEVLAKVGPDSIGKAEFERAVRMIEGRAGQPVPVTQRDQVYRRILDQMIDIRLIKQEAQARSITVTDADVDSKLGEIKQKFKTEAEFTAELGKRQMTLDELKGEMRTEMLVEKTLEAEILPKAVVEQGELDTFYKENPDQFKQGEQLRASHILIGFDAKATDLQKKEARAVADGLLKRVKSGEDFAALAKQYSKDSGSAVNGGDLNFFPRGQMVPPFDAAAAALKPGEISEIVETQFGYHIIKLTDRKPARVVPLAEVSEKLTAFLKQQKQRQLAGEFVQSLRSKYKVEILI